MAYRLYLRPAAERDLQWLAKEIASRVEKSIDRLREEPRPRGSKKLSGYANEWRLRVGNYRILYSVDDAKKEVLVARIAHRREAYR